MRIYCVLKGNQLTKYSVTATRDITDTTIGTEMADNNNIASHQSQAYCLRRANHMSDMIENFDRMFKDESLTDCALICAEGHAIKAHRMILSASSPFFRTVFEQMSNQCPNYPMVYLKDMPMSDLRAIIEFIYTGEVTVGQEQLESVIRSGEALRIKGLVDIDRRENTNNSTATIAKKRHRKQRRKQRKTLSEKNENNENNKTEEEIEANDSANTSDSETELSDGDTSDHSFVGTPTDLSVSRTYNESIAASEDGIEPTRLLEQSMITGDTSNSVNSSNHNDQDRKLNYDGAIDLMSQISSAIINENNDHNHREIPSVPGTSRCSQLKSNDKRKPKSSKKSLSSAVDPTILQLRQQRFQCHICHQGFTAKRNLQRHYQIHNYYRNKFECEHCDRQFSWKHTLNIHREKAHNIKL
ncbi:zinc finger and BTB domain-containing protein 41-like [Oppia nitens]|uniref:zinc finger and BTB domain-containing protein 41-like n=1 Tax=Oppia nitens TaxID=1686743 RepID=UPI0023DC73FC|nr:zinc finger and BTB domain-containing protein 41-like [Oppia nitens]